VVDYPLVYARCSDERATDARDTGPSYSAARFDDGVRPCPDDEARSTRQSRHDNRVKDRQTDKDFRCRHRALTGQRGPTDQDLSGLLYVAPAYGYVFICIPGSPLQVAKPRSLIE